MIFILYFMELGFSTWESASRKCQICVKPSFESPCLALTNSLFNDKNDKCVSNRLCSQHRYGQNPPYYASRNVFGALYRLRSDIFYYTSPDQSPNTIQIWTRPGKHMRGKRRLILMRHGRHVLFCIENEGLTPREQHRARGESKALGSAAPAAPRKALG